MKVYPMYPSSEEVDGYIEALWKRSAETPCTATVLHDNLIHNSYGAHHLRRSTLVKFDMPGFRSFYGMWTPAIFGPAPLLVHTCGYGAELSFHPEMAAKGYNVLQLSPFGYWTPEGMPNEMRIESAGDRVWPVLSNTAEDAFSDESYFGWLLNAMGATEWAKSQPTVLADRVSFFGTSQGGGASLLLGSIFKDRGTRCVCAEEPFLTDFVKADFRGAYNVMMPGFEAAGKEKAFHNLGYIDTLSHVHRMNYPVWLSLGTADQTCPPDTVAGLFERLEQSDKVLYSMKNRGHAGHAELIPLAIAWFTLYA